MFSPLYRMSRIPLLKRMPLHSSQISSTSARNCISPVTVPSPWQVEREVPRRVAAFLGVARRGEKPPDQIERFNIGHRVRAWRASDRRLVDHYRLADRLRTLHLPASQPQRRLQ